MKNIYLLIFLLLPGASFTTSAQDYAPFRMGNTPYFQAGDSIYSLRITSVHVQGGDSVFEFNPRIAYLPNGPMVAGCYGNKQADAMRTSNNLFGESMTRIGNDYEFMMNNGTSFLLKPWAAVGATWQFSNSPQLTATMQSRTSATVLNTTDSLAIIMLSNGSSIEISKKHGLIKARSFYSYLFPASVSQPLNLVRLPEAGVGNAIDHPFRIFDYQVGDKFLHKGLRKFGMPPCYEYWITTEVLSRNQNPDSLWYTIRKQTLTYTPQWMANLCSRPPGYTISDFDTVRFVVRPQEWKLLFDLGQAYGTRTAHSAYNDPNGGYFQSVYNNRMATSFNMMHQDTCSFTFHSGVCAEGFMYYAEGLGRVKMYQDQNDEEELIAYIKGSETYGNWAPLTGTNDKISTQKLQLYPNPFTTEFTLQLPEADAVSEAAEVTIYNLQGRQVFRQKVSSLSSQTGVNLALGHLPTGLYLLHLQQGEKSYSAKVQRQ